MTERLQTAEDINTGIRLERVICPRCKSDRSRVVYNGKDYLHGTPGDFSASECEKCELLFQNPRPILSDIGKLYPNDYLPHIAVDENAQDIQLPAYTCKFLSENYGYSHLYTRKNMPFSWKALSIFFGLGPYTYGVQLIPDFVPNGKLLEIGCASGARLLELKKMGWQNLFGIELVPEAAEKARAQGLTVECGQIEDKIDNYPDAYFDTVISSMVVEHLVDPFTTLEKVARKIKPGGQFLFSTVVHNGIDAKMYKGYWVGFDFPRHMVYFTKKDLLRILADQYEDVKTYSQNAPIDFKRSTMWRLKSRDGNFGDRIIGAIADWRIFKLLGYGLALLGLTSRISLKAKRKMAG